MMHSASFLTWLITWLRWRGSPAKSHSWTFRLETLKALTLLRITDNGPGISAEARAQLFRTSSAPTSNAAHGHGLLIARELAERNGGTLQFAEAAPGAQFVLTLSSLAAVDSSTSPSLGKRITSR